MLHPELRFYTRHYTGEYTAMSKAKKPPKPTPDFPLCAHSSDQWAKKIGRKTTHFGLWSDPDGALARYHSQDPASTNKIARPGTCQWV
jgi:hypothetical protein